MISPVISLAYFYRGNILVSTEEAFHAIAPGATEAFRTAS